MNDNPQRTPAWTQGRCGFVTASKFSAVMAKGKEGLTRAKYLRQVLAERLTGIPHVGFQNNHTERGLEQEPFGCEAFEVETGLIAEPVGFLIHPRLARVGCSPDRLVGDDAGLEIKCVLPHIQVETILRDSMPPEHKPQVYGGMWVTGRKRWHLGSFCPDMPAHLRLVVYTVEWDDDYIAKLSAEVIKFDNEVSALYARLMETRPLAELLEASVK